jgi:serine/threonine protein phosphatase PrpC
LYSLFTFYPASAYMKISAHGHSDVGFLRETNEDSFLVCEDKSIFAVSDGVGGLPYGSLASLLAVQFFESLMLKNGASTDSTKLCAIIRNIHENIIKCGAIVGGQNGIGTTFSGVVLLDDKIIYGHVGDSFILKFEKESQQLLQISKEHTLAAELIAKHGPDAAVDMPEHYNHTLTRCLGQDIDFDVDAGSFEVQSGDKIILCSDGLVNMVEMSDISKACASMNPKDLVHDLIDQANQNGGVDNTTVVCIEVE